MTLGTRVAVMRDGAIEQIGPAVALFRRPANLFVAGFVGSPARNLWRGACRRFDGRTRVASAVCSIDLDEVSPGVPDGAELVAGVRPHDIDLTSDGDGDGTGRVEIVEPLGPVTLVHLRVAGLPEFVRVTVPSDTRIGVDDQARFRIRRDRLHLFDGRTGRRLN